MINNFINKSLYLKNKLQTLNDEKNELQGQCSLLSNQVTNSEHKLEELNHNRELYRKSIELLTFVQLATKEKIKNEFKNLVSYALRYVFNKDYNFRLNFGRRGNLSELKFELKSPENDEYLELSPEGQAGGILDVVAMALRIVLLELYKPKIEGFLILDETLKHLHPIPTEYLERVGSFIKGINKKFHRQIIMITGREQLIKSADNLIEMK